jgi:DNA-directed RNA polymerase subunit RPC12/RpoP
MQPGAITPQGYLMMALIATGGTYIAVRLTRAIGARSVPPTSHESDEPKPIPMRSLFQLHQTARWAIRWLTYLVFVAVLIQKSRYATAGMPLKVAAITWVCLTLPLGLFILAFEIYLRCNSCGRRLLIKTVDQTAFPSPLRQQVSRTGMLQCMHCGQRYLVKTVQS